MITRIFDRVDVAFTTSRRQLELCSQTLWPALLLFLNLAAKILLELEMKPSRSSKTLADSFKLLCDLHFRYM